MKQDGSGAMLEKMEAQGQNHIINLQAGAHVMMLNPGVFCIFHAPDQRFSETSQLPGVRISRAPGVSSDNVEIITFDKEGWISTTRDVALVRVTQSPAGVLVTTYQEPGGAHEAPKLRVMQLVDSSPAASSVTAPPEAKSAEAGRAEVAAHVQRRGDMAALLGEWVGEPGSQAWIEGFEILPHERIAAEDIEYQAVLGKGWLSPWVEGGHFCGSRGMSLPILGLRVRLKGESAKKWHLRLTASFTDGTELGPVTGEMDVLQSESLSPLEAFRLEVVPAGEAGSASAPVKTAAVKAPRVRARHAKDQASSR